MGKMTSVLLLATLLLTACGNSGANGNTAKETNASNNPPTAAATQSAETTAPSPEATASPTPEATADGGTTGNSTASKGEASAEIPLLYHMNKNYDIVPNEEATNKKWFCSPLTTVLKMRQ